MDTCDVIEIGEDGTFEIPISLSAKQSSSKSDKTFLDESLAFSNAESRTADFNKEGLSTLNSVGPGEYKVFRNKATGTIYVLICLQDNEFVSVVNVSRNAIMIDLGCNGQLDLPLPCSVDSGTAISKSFNKYITVEMTCI